MRRTRLAIRRKTLADEQDGRRGQNGQDGHEGQEGQEPEGQPRVDEPDRQDQQDRQDGLEGQDGQDRREADAEIQDGESLPKRGAAELKAILEALIFASPDPLTPKAMCKLLDTEPKEDVLAAVAELNRTTIAPAGCSSLKSPAATRSSRDRISTNGSADCSTSAPPRS
jgi:hypothetical protein